MTHQQDAEMQTCRHVGGRSCDRAGPYRCGKLNRLQRCLPVFPPPLSVSSCPLNPEKTAEAEWDGGVDTGRACCVCACMHDFFKGEVCGGEAGPVISLTLEME